jgi:hypothetical protein
MIGGHSKRADMPVRQLVRPQILSCKKEMTVENCKFMILNERFHLLAKTGNSAEGVQRSVVDF